MKSSNDEYGIRGSSYFCLSAASQTLITRVLRLIYHFAPSAVEPTLFPPSIATSS
jgi:hypothetical protein